MVYFRNENSRWLDIKNVAITRMIKLIKSREIKTTLFIPKKSNEKYSTAKENTRPRKWDLDKYI